MMSKIQKAKTTISTTWLIRLARMLLAAQEHRLQVRDQGPKAHKTSRSFCGEMASKYRMTDLSDRWMIRLTPHS